MDTLSKKNRCLFSAQTNAFINDFLWSSPLENCATFFCFKKNEERRVKIKDKKKKKRHDFSLIKPNDA